MAVFVVDTETTSYASHPLASIIEVGAIAIIENEIVGNYTSFVKPLHPLGAWSDKAFQITGIKPSEVLAARDSDDVWREMLEWMAGYKPIDQILAWNVPFDKTAFEKTFKHSELLPWGPCLMRSASFHKRKNKKSYALVAAANEYGVAWNEQQHRALEDARVAAEIYIRCNRPESGVVCPVSDDATQEDYFIQSPTE